MKGATLEILKSLQLFCANRADTHLRFTDILDIYGFIVMNHYTKIIQERTLLIFNVLNKEISFVAYILEIKCLIAYCSSPNERRKPYKNSFTETQAQVHRLDLCNKKDLQYHAAA